jgi:predicted nucleotide-binding protein
MASTIFECTECGEQADKWLGRCPRCNGWNTFAQLSKEETTTRSGKKAGTRGRRVFVVHGRNIAARDSLFAFLAAVGLEPLEWEQAVRLTKKASPFIGEVLSVAFANAQAVIVLLTPDDEVRLTQSLLSGHDDASEREFQQQARANVIFEAGLAFGYMPDRTVLVEIGRVKQFSDLAGRHVIRLENSPEKRQALAERLKTAGCDVTMSGAYWYTAGDFNAANRSENEK